MLSVGLIERMPVQALCFPGHVMSTVPNTVPLIVRVRTQLKVVWSITARVSVFVAHLCPRTITHELSVDQSMGEENHILTVTAKSICPVSLGGNERDHDSALAEVHPATIGQLAVDRPDPTTVRDLVISEVTRYRAPILVIHSGILQGGGYLGL